MKILALIVLSALVCSCSINAYDKASKEMNTVYLWSPCCGNTISWDRLNVSAGSLEEETYTPDLENCVAELKDRNYGTKTPITVAVIEIVICMKERGWTPKFSEVLYTS